MHINVFPNYIAALAISLFPFASAGQTLAPLQTSGFGEASPIQASVVQMSNSQCRAVDSQTGDLHHYDVRLSGTVTFTNSSAGPVILYKDLSVIAGRVALSPKAMAAGKFVAGFDADRLAISGEPKNVSMGDFAVIGPGGSFTHHISVVVPGSTDGKAGFLHIPGRYWIELGVDARPDRFYFEPKAEKEFKNEWRSRGELVGLILARPFPFEVMLDLNAPLCKN